MSDIGSPILTSLRIKNAFASDVAAFIGETSRPVAILLTAYGAMRATIILALKVNSPEAAVFVGAVFLGVGTIFGVKGWEKVAQTRADADVKKAAGTQ